MCKGRGEGRVGWSGRGDSGGRWLARGVVGRWGWSWGSGWGTFFFVLGWGELFGLREGRRMLGLDLDVCGCGCGLGWMRGSYRPAVVNLFDGVANFDYRRAAVMMMMMGMYGLVMGFVYTYKPAEVFALDVGVCVRGRYLIKEVLCR